MGHLKALQYICYREKVDSHSLIPPGIPGPPVLRLQTLSKNSISTASPVAASFGSVRLNKGAIVELAVADYIPCAPFGVHTTRRVGLGHVVDDVVFGKEKFVAAANERLPSRNHHHTLGHCKWAFPSSR